MPALPKLRARGLRARLLLAHLVVIGLGMATVVLITELAAPGLFETYAPDLATPGATGAAATEAAVDRAFVVSVTAAVLTAAIVATIAAVVVSFLVSDRIATQVRRFADGARRVAAGHYSERVQVDGFHPADEFGQLVKSFNAMAQSLEETELRRTRLIGDVAHELRTPIATLEGYLEGLLDGMVQPGPEIWARLHDEAGRLHRLVDDLQDLSRAESRQLSLRVEPVDPLLIVQAAVDRVHSLFEDRGLDLLINTPGGLPPVSADRDRSVQVLTNLLTNALRYTPVPGRVTLALSLDPGGGEVCFSLVDTGIGIPAEHLPNVFERFYRVDKSRSRAAGGSGIGLTISKALVEAMGGRIWAESPGPNRGSTFHFTLPAGHLDRILTRPSLKS